MTLIRIICLVLAALTAGYAQRSDNYAYYKSTSLFGAGQTITLQQPASGSRLTIPDSATLYCSVVCTWTLSINGTGATGTAATEITVSETARSPVATVFHGSDVSGTTTIATYVCSAGEKLTIDLSSIRMSGDGTGKNVTLATNSITGLAVITLIWSEF